MNAFERAVIADMDRPLAAELKRARSLAARLEGICAERERLLWLAIEAHTSHVAEAAVARQIAQHLRETAFVPGMHGLPA